MTGNPQFGQGKLSVSVPHRGQVILTPPFQIQARLMVALLPPRRSFFDDDLILYSFLQLSHMRDDRHQTVALGQTCQSADRLLQGFFVERAKALVYKHGVQSDSAGGALYLV